jgi:hypothetical protein
MTLSENRSVENILTHNLSKPSRCALCHSLPFHAMEDANMCTMLAITKDKCVQYSASDLNLMFSSKHIE